MSKYRVVNLIDKLFVSFCIFLIVYAWINFYLKSLWTTFILSIIFSGAIIFILYYFLDKKQTKIETNRKITDEINENFFLFRLTPKQKKLELLKSILSENYQTTLKNGILTYIKDNKKHLVIIATHFEKMTTNDLINLVDELNEIDYDCFDVFCNTSINVNTHLFEDKTISLIDKQTLFYEYFKKNNIFPNKENINLKITKINFKDIIYGFFAPQKAKSFFFCGLILIFSSIILPFYAYYIVFGSMLLLFSIICKILPKFTKN